MALTRRQQVFIEEYLNCWNASEAARRAGYSIKTARFIGDENLAKPDIAIEIERLIAERGVKPPEVLERLGAQARADIGLFFKESFRWSQWPLSTDEIVDEKQSFDDKGKPCKLYQCRRLVFDLEKMRDPSTSRLIRKFTDSPKSGMSIELYDAQAALEKLGKALGVLRDNVTVSNEGSIELVTRVVRKSHDEAGS